MEIKLLSSEEVFGLNRISSKDLFVGNKNIWSIGNHLHPFVVCAKQFTIHDWSICFLQVPTFS